MLFLSLLVDLSDEDGEGQTSQSVSMDLLDHVTHAYNVRLHYV